MTEKETLEKTHLEALISEWKFQCAEGIETYPRDRMFEICYEDAYKQGKKEGREEAKEIIKNLMLFAEMDNREYELEYKEAEAFLKE